MKKQEIKIVLDTNVWVSALLWGGKPAEIIKVAELGEVKIFISEEIIAEINQVLTYPKLARIYQETEIDKNELIQQILRIAKFVRVTSKVDVIHEHASDNKFLDCALDSKADCIVSGDKHVLNVVSYKGIKMLSVSEFLRLLE